MSRTLAVRSVPPGVLQHARLISASALQNVTRLVTEANKPSALLDADLQANVLRELNRYSLPKEVIVRASAGSGVYDIRQSTDSVRVYARVCVQRRYESNMIAKSEDAKREYIKALASLNLLDSSKLLSVLGRGGNQADYNSAFFQQPLTIAAPAPASPPMPIPLPVQVQVSMWQRVGSILMIGAVLYFVARPFLNKGEEGSGSGKSTFGAPYACTRPDARFLTRVRRAQWATSSPSPRPIIAPSASRPSSPTSRASTRSRTT